MSEPFRFESHVCFILFTPYGHIDTTEAALSLKSKVL